MKTILTGNIYKDFFVVPHLYLEINKNWFIKNKLNLDRIGIENIFDEYCENCNATFKGDCLFLYGIKSKTFFCDKKSFYDKIGV
ncbi:hypothetical protein M0R19_03795 [Candidatus Pacearchaeota archaeon]|nr:hypothetical protein [Candidatus Pacearchaeota archaeon]